MTWIRTDDADCEDPRVIALVRTRAEHQRVLGMRAMLRERCARARTDGYLSSYVVRQILSPRWLALFCAPPDGGAALLHRRDDFSDGTLFCPCLRAGAWPPGADYAVHGYLDTNPTRDETDVARAKAAELRDPQLRLEVRTRDQDRCRYCHRPVRQFDHRSGAGLVLDHVDPAFADGAANLVVACRDCNSRKGNRTPAQAGMTLLPPWVDPGPGNGHTPAPTPGPTTSPRAGDGTGRATDPTTPATPDPAGGGAAQVQPPPSAASNPGGGNGGPAQPGDRVGPPTTRRTPARPNPHTRRAITGPQPENHAGIPADPPPRAPP